MKGWKRETGKKSDWRRKAEMERQQGSERKKKIRPVVVEMSATGAAEMEKDG